MYFTKIPECNWRKDIGGLQTASVCCIRMSCNALLYFIFLRRQMSIYNCVRGTQMSSRQALGKYFFPWSYASLSCKTMTYINGMLRRLEVRITSRDLTQSALWAKFQFHWCQIRFSFSRLWLDLLRDVHSGRALISMNLDGCKNGWILACGIIPDNLL